MLVELSWVESPKGDWLEVNISELGDNKFSKYPEDDVLEEKIKSNGVSSR